MTPCMSQAASGRCSSFRENIGLQALLRDFYEANKVTSLICHGVCALLDIKLSSGDFLITGKTITGVANTEEDDGKRQLGKDVKFFPYQIEDEAKKRGANLVASAPWRPFAVRDLNLITGQQHFSGRLTARMVIDALGA
jgi:putative intracellular protease/amidase